MNTFEFASLTLLLQQPWLIQPERLLLKALLDAASQGIYWGELARMDARYPDILFVIRNVVTKAKAGGLVYALEHLKAHYDHEHQV